MNHSILNRSILKSALLAALLITASATVQAQSPSAVKSADTLAPSPSATRDGQAVPQRLTLNLFRNPSIGAEYRTGNLAFHLGAYTTIISQNEQGESVATWFVKAGATYWATEFYYVSASYLYGLNNDWQNRSGVMVDTGLQATVLERVHFRLGVAALFSQGHSPRLNPTPGVSVDMLKW